MRRTLTTGIVVALIVLSGCAGFGGDGGANTGDGAPAPAVDGGGAVAGDVAQSSSGQSVGYSVGGAQDATAFRTNVREGYVPQPTDLTYEGLFRDYYFDRGQDRPCEALFCPSYSKAVAEDPISGGRERFVTVGLNSGLSRSDFERKKLDLVVVLDTSDSMDSAFDRYYYDDSEKREVESRTSKMAAAAEAVSTLTTHLGDGDRLGVVTYDNDARVFQEMRDVESLDLGRLRERLRGIRADGGTDLDAGMTTARSMLAPYRDANQSEYETRVIYVTDAMPNTGDTGGESLRSRLQGQAQRGLHATFVGVGVDFNSRLVETITSVRGANYYTVESPAEFSRRMDQGFDYMVTPLVYNLSLTVDGSGYDVEEVYGTTAEGRTTGRLLHVRTLFPSRTEGNRTKGGVVLVELERTGENPRLNLTASYEDRVGTTYEQSRTITFEDRTAPYFESSGVRKAVVLQAYGALVRNWAAHQRAQGSDREGPGVESADAPIEHRKLGQWEQRSVPLELSQPYDRRIERFEAWFDDHRAALGEDALARDARVLDILSANSTAEG